MKKEHIKLSEQDKSALLQLVSKGVAKARIIKRAMALLRLDEGASYKSVAKFLGVLQGTVAVWGKKYAHMGLDKILHDEARPGRPPTISGEAKAKITALACTDPPDGYSDWSLRMLANRAVELNFCESVSHSRVGAILKKRTQAPFKEMLVHWSDGE